MRLLKKNPAVIQLVSAIILLTAVSACNESKPAKRLSGNPIARGWYADPEAVMVKDRLWVFPTFSAAYKDQVFMDAFSTANLVDWQKHERIIDTSAVKWARMAMWAPCMVEKDGKYFLFFAANDIQTAERMGDTLKFKDDHNGGIGVAVADKPEGPYIDYLGKPLINEFYNKAQPIDQFVFRDKDGQYYIIYGGWGHCNIAKLKDDFTGIIPFDDKNTVKEITPEGYVEGPFMFIRNEKYYLMWSEGNWTDESYKVAYAVADSPFGPFNNSSTILKTDTAVATGAGHHSVFNVPGTDEWYIVYHRRPVPNEGRDHRVICIDRMYFNEDGTIKDVKITFEGVEERALSVGK
jgi:beta-xylosidase